MLFVTDVQKYLVFFFLNFRKHTSFYCHSVFFLAVTLCFEFKDLSETNERVFLLQY